MGFHRTVVLLACAGGLAGCAGGRADAGRQAQEERVAQEVARRAGTEAVLAPAGCDPAVDALLREPLTAAHAVRIALLRNGSVRESYERLGIARADLLQAGLLSNPVFSADAKFFSGGPEIELGLARSFLDLFFVPLRKRVARADLAAEEAAVTRDLVRLVHDVRRAFAEVHAADAVVALREEVLTASERSRDLMLRLHEAGNTRDTRRTIEESEAVRARLELDAARTLAMDAREPLVALLGLRGRAAAITLEAAPAGVPAEVATEGLEAKALAASLDLLEECARIQGALFRAGLVRKEGAWPLLDLGVVGKRESEGPWGFGPEVSTALPVFDQGQAKVLAANATLRQRVARHAQTTVEVESAARRLGARARAARARAETLRTAYLPLRERLVEETLQFFNAMQIGAFDVLHAKQQELDARREHVETVRDAWIAWFDLQELLAGSLNPDRLAPPHVPDAAESPDAPEGH